MDRRTDPAEWPRTAEAARRARVREALVTRGAVLAVVIASFGAVLSQRPTDASAGAASAAAGDRCANCGVVESVVALQPADGFEVRVRMNDGSLRSVAHGAALARGSRVLLAGRGLRVLRSAGQHG